VRFHADVVQSEIYGQMAEVALENAAVSVDQVEVIRAAANVNMIAGGKMDCVMLVCNAAGLRFECGSGGHRSHSGVENR
jgi:hypothetical protein